MPADTSSRAPDWLPHWLWTVYELMWASYEHWRATRTLRLGAGIAYYALFAIVPLLSLGAAIVAQVVSVQDAQQFLADALADLLDESAQAAAQRIVDGLADAAGGLGVLGFVLVLVSASFLFVAIQDALNVIWEDPVRVGFRNTVRRRLLALGIALAVALFIVSSLVIQAVVGLAERFVPGDNPIIESLSPLISSAGSWAVGVLLIAVMFRVLPYSKVRWRDALLGAALTAAFMTVGSAVIGAYLARFGSTSITGVAGGVVLILGLVYYQAQILLGGAVLTKIIGDRNAHRPAATAP